MRGQLVAHSMVCYSQTTSKLKCVGSPRRIIYTVFGKPPVSLLKLFDYITPFRQPESRFIQAKTPNRLRLSYPMPYLHHAPRR